MKISFTHEEFSLRVRWLTVFFKSAPRRLLLQHSRGLEIGLLVLTLIFSVVLTIWLLYVVPQQVSLQPPLSAPLAAEALDELKQWIQERQRAFETGITLPERPIFVD